MYTPKISVILPVYNGEKYLDESVDSIIAQGFTDYELLICDDCSTDRSADMVQRRRDSRIILFRNTVNKGLFKSLNILVNKARGEYIRVWSQDDVMKPDCLQAEIEFHKQHPEVGMSYCARDIINDSGKVIMIAPEDKTPDIIYPEQAAQIMFYYGSIAGPTSSAMLKKSVFAALGPFCEDMQVAGDFDMWTRISSKYPIGFIREALMYMRSHGRQFSRRKGIAVTFMKEDNKIIHSLMKRLPSGLMEYARTYNRWSRYPQYAHYVMHCFLDGDFENAVKTYKELRKLDNPFIVMGIWLITVNGRFFKKGARFVNGTANQQRI